MYSLSSLSIGRALGKGRFGQVYEARLSNESRRPVALKVLSKALLARGGCEAQLARELETHARLSTGRHPHILALHGSFEDDARAYLVLALAPGGALDRELRAAGRLSEPRAARIVAAVIDGLHFAHCHNIAHRDIKPENVLLDSDGAPLLSDWGWAAELPDPSSRRHTLAGSPEFASPEVLDGSGHSTPADVWSLGVLAFELLTGRTPFAVAGDGGALDVGATFARIAEGRWTWPGVADDVPDAARDLVEACLRVDPAARPTMAVLLHHPWVAPYVRPGAAAWNARRVTGAAGGAVLEYGEGGDVDEGGAAARDLGAAVAAIALDDGGAGAASDGRDGGVLPAAETVRMLMTVPRASGAPGDGRTVVDEADDCSAAAA